MAQKVIAQVLGGEPKVITADTAYDAAVKLGLEPNQYQCNVNDEPVSMDYTLEDRDDLLFTQNYKGN